MQKQLIDAMSPERPYLALRHQIIADWIARLPAKTRARLSAEASAPERRRTRKKVDDIKRNFVNYERRSDAYSRWGAPTMTTSLREINSLVDTKPSSSMWTSEQSTSRASKSRIFFSL